ncbi:MAG: DUF1080 domain-containing protein [Bacteroidia bacterium]|nr:DUF1080 domain-containing protein [Bacteroidia bacterium]
MKKLSYVLLIMVVSACHSGVKKDNQSETATTQVQETALEGISLFDGKTLDGWEITSFGTEGPVSVSDGNIVLAFGDGCTGVTWIKDFPRSNYEVTLEAMRVSGNDFFCGMTFPVNESHCSLIVGGWGGPVVGLSTIDGNDAANNSTKILKKFDKNVWYKIKLQVTDENIVAWIDDEVVVDFEIGDHVISIRPEVGLSRPFGITSWNTTAALRNIRLKVLND